MEKRKEVTHLDTSALHIAVFAGEDRGVTVRLERWNDERLMPRDVALSQASRDERRCTRRCQVLSDPGAAD